MGYYHALSRVISVTVLRHMHWPHFTEDHMELREARVPAETLRKKAGRSWNCWPPSCFPKTLSPSGRANVFLLLTSPHEEATVAIWGLCFSYKHPVMTFIH